MNFDTKENEEAQRTIDSQMRASANPGSCDRKTSQADLGREMARGQNG